MDNMLIFIVVFVIIIALGAVVAAIVVMNKNSKEQKAAPEISTRATVVKTYSQSHESMTVDSANAQTTSTYYVEFLLADQSTQTFKINKKLFKRLHDGDVGTLNYKGYKVLSFEEN